MSGLLAKFMPWLIPSLIAVAVATGMWLYTDLTLTKNALELANERAEQWQQISEAQERIRVREESIQRASNIATRIIREAPNANTPVPPDISHAWAVSIDSVRDAGTNTTNEHDDMPRTSGGAPKRRGADIGPADRVLEGPRNRVLAVQRKS